MDPMKETAPGNPVGGTGNTNGAGGSAGGAGDTLQKKPGRLSGVLFAIACALLAGTIPTGFLLFRQPGTFYETLFSVSGEELIPAILCGASALIAFVLFGVAVRGIRPLVIPGALFLIAISYVGPYAAVAGLVTVLVAALAGYLVTARGMNVFLLLPVAAVSYLVSFALVRDPVTALFALLPYPAAAFLAHANSDHAGCAETMARTSAGLFLSAGLLFAISALIREGHVDLSRIVDAVDSLRPWLKQLFLDNGMGLIDEKVAASVSDMLVNLLPGVVLVGFEAGGYLIQLTETGLFNGDESRRMRRALPHGETDSFRMSAVSGGIFLLSVFISMFGDNSAFFTVLDNLAIVLMIPMFVVGVRYLVTVYRSPRARFRILPIALAVLSVFLYGLGAIPLLFEAVGLLGASDAVFRPIRDKLGSMRQGGE